MAPPSQRRPGFSRRAQYGLFITYVLAVAGIAFALLMLVLSAVDPRGFNALRGVMLDITTPITSVGRSIVRGVAGSGDAVSNYIRAGSQNADLRDQLSAVRRQVIEGRTASYENARLKKLLGIAQNNQDRIAMVRVVGSTFDSSRRLATIDAGSSDGILIGQTVRGPEGLIGRVIEAGRGAARVLLVTDGASNIPVREVRSGIAALATGKGDGTIEIKPLEIGRNPFRRGDLFVTSGTGGIFAPNIPVAFVIRADNEITLARPLAEPARLDFAMVQGIYQPAADLPLTPAEAGQ